MTYFRIHTADIAWITQQPRGLFTAIGKLVEAKTLTEEETAEYWKNREYFEKILPVPPFYEQGNPDHAITWFKDTPQGNDIYRQMTFYRKMANKYGLKFFISKCTEQPGEVIYEDDFQIAVKNQKPDAAITVSELKVSEQNVTLDSVITREEYIEFRATTPWTPVRPNRVDELLKNSTFLVRAKVDGKTAGIARALFDYGYTMYIGDVIVKPEYQGQGIGRMLVEHLISKAKESVDPEDFLFINLMAAKGKDGFYEKLGFAKRDDQTGWGMQLKINSK